MGKNIESTINELENLTSSRINEMEDALIYEIYKLIQDDIKKAMSEQEKIERAALKEKQDKEREQIRIREQELKTNLDAIDNEIATLRGKMETASIEERRQINKRINVLIKRSDKLHDKQEKDNALSEKLDKDWQEFTEKVQNDINTVNNEINESYETYDGFRVNGAIEAVEKQLDSQLEPDKQEDSEQHEDNDYEGHLYPVKLVKGWTSKLKGYNTQLESFLSKIEKYDDKANKKWVKEKVQAFCEKINYLLAWLRYYIVKALHTIYQQVQKVIPPLKLVTTIPDSPDKCVTWAADVIKLISGPYGKLIELIQDFTTYTPPLVSEAVKLISNVSKIGISIPKKLARIFKDTIKTIVDNFKIEMKPITLGDVISGNAQKPTLKRSKINSNKGQTYKNLVLPLNKQKLELLEFTTRYKIYTGVTDKLVNYNFIEFVTDEGTIYVTIDEDTFIAMMNRLTDYAIDYGLTEENYTSALNELKQLDNAIVDAKVKVATAEEEALKEKQAKKKGK